MDGLVPTTCRTPECCMKAFADTVNVRVPDPVWRVF
jgi:hypothetical protein